MKVTISKLKSKFAKLTVKALHELFKVASCENGDKKLIRVLSSLYTQKWERLGKSRNKRNSTSKQCAASHRTRQRSSLGARLPRRSSFGSLAARRSARRLPIASTSAGGNHSGSLGDSPVHVPLVARSRPRSSIARWQRARST